MYEICEDDVLIDESGDTVTVVMASNGNKCKTQ